MHAIILSAGKGSRMYPLTASTPKCLIDIGNGTSVLQNQLNVLIDCGITSIYIVAGYLIEQVEDMITKYDSDADIQILHNPFYETSNNIISLWLGLLQVDGPSISINGDNIFKKSVISKLLKTPGDIVMTIDKKQRYDSDDMLAVIEGNRVVAVGKKIANAESVGIIKFTLKGYQEISKTLHSMLKDQSNHSLFYLSAMQEIMDSDFEVLPCEIEPGDWAEIDFHPDLEDLKTRIRENAELFE